MDDVGWVANGTSLGTTLPPPEASNATQWAFLNQAASARVGGGGLVGGEAEQVECTLPELYGGAPGTPKLQGLAIAPNGQQFADARAERVAFGAFFAMSPAASASQPFWFSK